MTPARFGEVWESRHEAIGTMRYLVVSGDSYNEVYGDRRVIAVEVDPNGVYAGPYREPVPDAGTAHLDRLVWVARSQLEEHVANLHPERYAAVAEAIRTLIGN